MSYNSFFHRIEYNQKSIIMWSYRYLSRLDFRVFPILFGLMVMSLLVIATNTVDRLPEGADDTFFTPVVRSQIKWYV